MMVEKKMCCGEEKKSRRERGDEGYLFVLMLFLWVRVAPARGLAT